jgi:hypothetical protein
MTIKQYYESYKSLLGIFAGIVTVSPLLTLIPLEFSKYIFPPLGNIDIIARLGTVGFALLTTYVVYFCQEKAPGSTRRLIFVSFSLFAVSAIIYAVAYLCSVRTIQIPAARSSATVSIGYERSAFAKDRFAGATDEDILRYRGTDEEEIRRCWALGYLVLSRIILWISSTAELSFLVSALGFGIVLMKGQEVG